LVRAPVRLPENKFELRGNFLDDVYFFTEVITYHKAAKINFNLIDDELAGCKKVVLDITIHSDRIQHLIKVYAIPSSLIRSFVHF
jgi:hypothetical protein